MSRMTWKPLLILTLAVLVALPALSGTERSKAKNSPVRKSKAQSGVRAVLDMQIEAWNRGDIDTFMTGYLNSPDISYTSAGAEVWGYEAMKKRYQDRYGNKRDTMGTLSFSDLKISELGTDNALCIGHWHLTREGQPNLDGIFSLVLVRSGGDWKIIHDHTSVVEKKS